MSLKENLEKVKKLIQGKARLVAVVKHRDIEEVEKLIELGVKDFGENRVESLEGKAKVFPKMTWHFIGNIQSNKIKQIVEFSDYIHSLYSVKHARKISETALELKNKIKVFIEINVSGEESKSGIKPSELKEFLQEVKVLKGIEVIGLMTMAPFVEAEKTRKYFTELKKLADENNLSELSIGMSNDFRVAVEEGATFVRIGTALFEKQ